MSKSLKKAGTASGSGASLAPSSTSASPVQLRGLGDLVQKEQQSKDMQVILECSLI